MGKVLSPIYCSDFTQSKTGSCYCPLLIREGFESCFEIEILVPFVLIDRSDELESTAGFRI
jgi:hypothetical protein